MTSGNQPVDRFKDNRFFLKDTIRQQVDFSATGQNRGLAAPPLQKPYDSDSNCIELPEGAEALAAVGTMAVSAAVTNRESVRQYSKEPFTLEELSAMLWATQGVRRVLNQETALRTVPSAGARHAFETYLAISNVDGIPMGLYRFLPFDNKLAELVLDEDISIEAARACLGQGFVANAAVTFFWTVIPARMEWRYDQAAHKVIAIDAGHVCQNLYLAAAALGGGACAIAAYDQEACDKLVGVDGKEEFTVYIAPVGKV